MSPASAAMRAKRVEGEDFDMGVIVAPGVVEDRRPVGRRRRDSAPQRRGRPAGIRRARPVLRRPRRGATQPPLRVAVARSRDLSEPHEGRGRGGPGRAPPGVRHRSPRPCRSRVPGWRHPRRSRRPGTAARPRLENWYASVCRNPSRRDASAARPRWTTASSNRCWMRASSPSTASRRTWSHGSSTIRSQCST